MSKDGPHAERRYLINPFTEHNWEGLAAAILRLAIYDTKHPGSLAFKDVVSEGWPSLRDELAEFWLDGWSTWLCEWFNLNKREVLRVLDAESLLNC